MLILNIQLYGVVIMTTKQANFKTEVQQYSDVLMDSVKHAGHVVNESQRVALKREADKAAERMLHIIEGSKLFSQSVDTIEKSVELDSPFALIQAKLNADLVKKHLQNYPLLLGAEFSEKIGYLGKNQARHTANLADHGKIFAIKDGRTSRYPEFQIDAKNQTIYPVLSDIIHHINFLPDRAIYAWFCTENPLLGCSPADALKDKYLHNQIIGVADSRRRSEHIL